MKGDTTTYTYRAVTDKLAKRVHLGAVETGTRAFCGTDLYDRKPEDRFEADVDLSRIDCGACRRMGRYKADVAGDVAEQVAALDEQRRALDVTKPERAKVPAARKPRGKAEPAAKPAAKATGAPTRKGTAKPAAGASAHEGDGGRQAPAAPAPRRKSRATRSAEISEAARAKREAEAAADKLLGAVEAEFGPLGGAAK